MASSDSNAFKETVNALRNFHWERLFKEQHGVVGNGFFARRVEEDHHVLGNIIRFCFFIIFSPIICCTPDPIAALVKDFFLQSWGLEKVDVPKSVLAEAPGSHGRGYYHPGQFRPRWLIKITFSVDGTHEAVPTCWTDDVAEQGYTALSYSYKNAEELFRQQYHEEFETDGIPKDAIPSDHPTHPDPRVFLEMKDDPLMAAWKEADKEDFSPEVQKTWRNIALRQRNAKVFLEFYLKAVKEDVAKRAERATREGMRPELQSVTARAVPPDQYVWLDELSFPP